MPPERISVFGVTAPKYYKRGLPVIPLFRQDKKPIIEGWNRFADRLPTPEEQNYWLRQHAEGNIGLVLGPQSGMIAIDIDTIDDKIKRVILGLVPPSPWKRVGAKGMVLAYRYNGMKTFRIKGLGGESIVEGLSRATQIVIPPSIHPTTKSPYTANVDLLEVFDQLPDLPTNIETILRQGLIESGVELSHSGWTRVTDFVAKGARDVQMTQVAGVFALGVSRGERTLSEALGMIDAWHSTLVEKIDGDPIDVQKGKQKVVEFLIKDVLGPKKRQLPKGWDEGLTDEEKKQLGLDFTVEHEQWSVEQMKGYLKSAFERFPDPDSAQRFQAIIDILARISNHASFSRLDEDRVLNYIMETSRIPLTLSGLRAQLKQLRSGELSGTNHSELANAVLEDFERIAPLRFNAQSFWQWQGSHWVKTKDEVIMKKIAEEYGHYAASKKQPDHRGITRVMSVLRSQELVDEHVRGVNFTNGVLISNEDGMKLVPHDPKYGMIYTLPFRYLPEMAGKCFRLREFLDDCWGGDEDCEEKVKAFQEALCVTLFAMGPKYEKAPTLFGVQHSGKSQMLKIVETLVPEEARCAVNPADWGDKFMPSMMVGKILNICGELSNSKRLDGKMLKDITSGGTIQAQEKNKPNFNFAPQCTHWFATNHLPKTGDTSNAFNRRWLFLHFTREVSDDKKVIDIGNIIVAEEREAIVAWAVEAMPRILAQNGYTIPKSHVMLIQMVAMLNNSVRHFLMESNSVKVLSPQEAEERLKKNLPTSTSAMKLHEVFYSFCVGVGDVQRVNYSEFKTLMLELGASMGFRSEQIPTPAGGKETIFRNLILAEKRVAS